MWIPFKCSFVTTLLLFGAPDQIPDSTKMGTLLSDFPTEKAENAQCRAEYLKKAVLKPVKS